MRTKNEHRRELNYVSKTVKKIPNLIIIKEGTSLNNDENYYVYGYKHKEI